MGYNYSNRFIQIQLIKTVKLKFAFKTQIKRRLRANQDFGRSQPVIPTLIGRVVELFLCDLCMRAKAAIRENRSKILRPHQILKHLRTVEKLDFLTCLDSLEKKWPLGKSK